MGEKQERRPSSRQNAEIEFDVKQMFSNGSIRQGPLTEIPEGYDYKLINLIANGKYRTGRPGSRRYTMYSLPTGALNGFCDHDKSGWLIFHFGTKLYVCDKAMTSYTEILNVTPDVSVANHESQIIEFSDYALICDGTTIFRINLNTTAALIQYYSINHALPTDTDYRIADTGTGTYLYRYFVQYSRIDGTDAIRNRFTDSVEWSTPVPVFEDGRDYAEITTLAPISPGDGESIALPTYPAGMRQATHASVFRSKNISEETGGYDDISGAGNNPENPAWVGDAAIAKAFYALVTSHDQTLFTVDITLLSGEFETMDLGAVIHELFYSQNDPTTDYDIEAITDSTHGKIGNILFGHVAFTTVDYTTGIIGLDTHFGFGPFAGMRFTIEAIDGSPAPTLPTGLAYNTEYWIIPAGTNGDGQVDEVKLATSYANAIAGTAIELTDNGANITSLMFTIDGTHVYFSIGTDKVALASQATTTVTWLEGDAFVNTNDAKKLWWADGGYSYLTNIATGAANTGTHALQAVAFTPTSRSFYDTVPDDGRDNDVIGIQQRLQSGKEQYLPVRFYSALPAADMIAISNAYFFTAERDGEYIRYSAIGARPEFIGYYRADIQLINFIKGIRYIYAFKGVLHAIHIHGHKGVNISVGMEVGDIDRGESIRKLGDPYDIDYDVGVFHYQSIARLGGGALIAVTSNFEVLIFDGERWIQNNLAYTPDGQAAIAEEITKINPTDGCVAGYSSEAGYILWIFGDVVYTYRLAVYPTQGRGWSEYNGDNWLTPGSGKSVFTVLDSNKSTRFLIVDDDGITYEHATFDRTTYTKPCYTDKYAGCSEHEIGTELWSKVITGDPQRHVKISHLVSHAYTLPQIPDNIGETDYDSNGYRDGQEFTLDIYQDGQIETVKARTENIPENGDIVFSGSKINSNKLMFVFKSTCSEFHLSGLIHTLLAEPKAGNRTERLMQEHTEQLSLETTKVLHISRHKTLLFDRVSKSIVAGTATATTGPDARSKSAFTLSESTALGNDAFSGDYSLILWFYGSPASIANVPGVPGGTVTQYGDTYGSWSMYEAVGSGSITEITLNAGNWFDVRLYEKQLTDAELEYIYRDIVYNNGNAVLPVF